MESIKAKLLRADELLITLEAEVKAFEPTIPPPRIEKGYKEGTSSYAFYAHGEVNVPLRYAILAGEVIHQLRSSLDHLIAHLVQSKGNAVTNTHQFPICSTKDRFNKVVSRGCIRGVAEQLMLRIEQYQPYNAPDPKTSPLLALQELNNSDKHRLLVVVAGAAQLGLNVRLDCAPNPVLCGMSPPTLQLRNGSEFFCLDFKQRCEKTNVEIDVETVLAFRRPAKLEWPFELVPLCLLLQQCRTAVHKVVATCLADNTDDPNA